MSSKLLCKWENQQEIRPLAVGFKANYDALSAEIQTVTLKKLLGIEFYNDLITNIDSTNAKYTDLFNGCSFTSGDYSYNHEGIITFLAHLITAEYQVRGKFHETAAGIIIKSNQDYEQVSLSAQKQLQAEMREYAFTFWTEIERFLCENSTTYTLYCSTNKKNVSTPIIDKIG